MISSPRNADMVAAIKGLDYKKTAAASAGVGMSSLQVAGAGHPSLCRLHLEKSAHALPLQSGNW